MTNTERNGIKSWQIQKEMKYKVIKYNKNWNKKLTNTKRNEIQSWQILKEIKYKVDKYKKRLNTKLTGADLWIYTLKTDSPADQPKSWDDYLDSNGDNARIFALLSVGVEFLFSFPLNH